MNEHFLDVRRSLRAIRRRWAPLLTFVVLGLTAGAAWAALSGTEYSAQARILLPPAQVDAQGRSLRDVRSAAYVVRSPEVLDPAGQAVIPGVSTRWLRERTRARPVSDDILEVRVTAPTRRLARALANGVAREYVAQSEQDNLQTSDLSITALERQSAELNQRLQELRGAIEAGVRDMAGLDPRSAAVTGRLGDIESKRGEEVEVARELNRLNTRIADARLAAELTRRGTRVLEAATTTDQVEPQILRNVAAGGLVGLVVGSLLALWLEQSDRRLRRRDELADAVGAPVLASLHAPAGGRRAQRRRLFVAWSPSVVESFALERGLAAVGVDGLEAPCNIVVVTVEGDPGGPALAFQLAAFAAARGVRTALLAATQDATMERFRAGYERSLAGGSLTRRNLSVHWSDADARSPGFVAASLKVAVVVARPGPVLIPRWNDRRTVTTLAVSSGFATADQLATVAAACHSAGQPIQGIFVANPDAEDDTSGRWPAEAPPPSLRWAATQSRALVALPPEIPRGQHDLNDAAGEMAPAPERSG